MATGCTRSRSLVVLEYPNGIIRLVRESEINAVFNGFKAEFDENEGC